MGCLRRAERTEKPTSQEEAAQKQMTPIISDYHLLPGYLRISLFLSL